MNRQNRALAFLGLLLSTAPAAAADWPQHLGPDRNAISQEAGLVEAWKAGTHVRWRVPVGAGYSSVSVVGDTVYAFRNDDGALSLMALDVASGAERWRTALGQVFDDDTGYPGPRSTPTVVGDRLYVLTGLGRLVCLSRGDGAIRWSRDLVAELGAERPTWGFASSPLVSEGRVYLAVGGSEERGLAAFDADSGATVWTMGTTGAAYSSPVRGTVAGHDVVLFFASRGLVGVSPDTGELRFQHPWRTDFGVHAATPLILGDDRVFVSSGYGVGGALLHIRPDGTVRELWKTKRMKNRMATSVRFGDTLYGFSEHDLAAIDAESGLERWYSDDYGRGSLVGADGHLWVISDSCRLSVIEASPEALQVVGTPVEVFSSTPCWTAPTVSGGVVYLRNGEELVALGLGPAPAP